LNALNIAHTSTIIFLSFFFIFISEAKYISGRHGVSKKTRVDESSRLISNHPVGDNYIARRSAKAEIEKAIHLPSSPPWGLLQYGSFD